MKRNVLILFYACFLTVLSNHAFGQTALTRAQFPAPIQKTIVKDYVFPGTISYVETATSHYFAFADASMTVVCSEIDPQIYVRDFTIYDDTVYFCGINKSNGCLGVWGYYSTADLISSNISYNIYDLFTCNKEKVDTLHNIAVFTENGNKHIVVVGTVKDGANNRSGCTIDITHAATPSNWNYTIGVTAYNSGEDIKRICITDDYVITVSTSSVYPDMETYRIHYKSSNLFPAAGPQNNVWMLSYPTWGPYSRNTDKFAITHMYQNTVAMAFQSKDENTKYNGIILYEYDMSTLTVGSTFMAYALVANTGMDSLDVEDLKYYAKTDDFVLLMNGRLSGFPYNGMGSIIATIHHGSNAIPMHYSDAITFQSLDQYNYQNNYLCMGVDNNDPTHAVYYTQPINTATACMDANTFIGNPPCLMVKQEQWPFKVCSDSFACSIKKPISTLSIPNPKVCD